MPRGRLVRADGAVGRGQTSVRPPSTYRHWPVMKPARSESEEGDGVGDLVRPAQPSGRDQRLELLPVPVPVEVAAGQVGLDVAGTDRVHGHAVRRPLPRHHAHHLVDAALGRGVRRVVRVREQGGHRGHEGHPAVAGGDHAAADLLAEPPRGGEVQREDRLPVVVAELEHRAAVVAAHRVQEQLGRSEDLAGLLHRRPAGLGGGDVGDQRPHLTARVLRPPGHLVQAFAVDVDHDGAGALRRQADRAGAAEPTGSDHQCRPAPEPQPVAHTHLSVILTS